MLELTSTIDKLESEKNEATLDSKASTELSTETKAQISSLEE